MSESGDNEGKPNRKPTNIQVRCEDEVGVMFKQFAVPYRDQEAAIEDLLSLGRRYPSELTHGPPPRREDV